MDETEEEEITSPDSQRHKDHDGSTVRTIASRRRLSSLVQEWAEEAVLAALAGR